MGLVELFANDAATKVVTGGTMSPAPASGTIETWLVADASSFPVATSGVSQFHVADDELPLEKIAVLATNGDTWTVLRGAEGTTPLVHQAGFAISGVVTAGALAAFLQAGVGAIAPAVVDLTYGATLTPDLSQGNHFRVTLTGGATLLTPLNARDGQRFIIEVVQDATGTRALSYDSGYSFGTGLGVPVLTAAANKRDFIGFIANTTTALCYCVAFANGY